MEYCVAETSSCCIGTFTVDLPYDICTGSFDNNAEIVISRVFASAANLVNYSLISPSPLSSSCNYSHINYSTKHCTTLKSELPTSNEYEHCVKFNALAPCNMTLQSSESSNVMDICSWVELKFIMPKEEKQCVKLEWTRQMQDYVSRFVDRALTRVYPMLDPLQYIHANSPLFKVDNNNSNNNNVNNNQTLYARFVICRNSTWKELYHVASTFICKNTDALTMWKKINKSWSSNVLNAWRLHTVEDEMLVNKEHSSIKAFAKDCDEEKSKTASFEQINSNANVYNNKTENVVYVNNNNNNECDVDGMKINYNVGGDDDDNYDDDDLWHRARAANTKNKIFEEESNDEVNNGSDIKGNFAANVIQSTSAQKVHLALDNVKYTWKVARLMTERMINSNSWALEQGEERNGRKRSRDNDNGVRYSNIIEATIATHKQLARQNNCLNVPKSSHYYRKPSSELNGDHNSGVNGISDDAVNESHARPCRLTHIDGCGIEFNATVVGYTRRYTYFGVPVASLSTLQNEESIECATSTTPANNKCSAAMNSAMISNLCIMHEACKTDVAHNNISHSTFHVVARTPHPSWHGLYNDSSQHYKIENINNSYSAENRNNNCDVKQWTRINNEKTMPVHSGKAKVPNYCLRNLRNALLFDEADSFVQMNAKEQQYTSKLRAHRVSCEYVFANIENSESESNAIAIWFDDIYMLSSQPIEVCTDDYKEVLSLVARSCTRYIASIWHFDECVCEKNKKKSSNSNNNINKTNVSASDENCRENNKVNSDVKSSECCNGIEYNIENAIYMKVAVRAKRLYDMMNDSVNVRFKKVKTSHRKREQASFIPMINTCRDIAPLREGCSVEFKHHLHLHSMNTNNNVNYKSQGLLTSLTTREVYTKNLNNLQTLSEHTEKEVKLTLSPMLAKHHESEEKQNTNCSNDSNNNQSDICKKGNYAQKRAIMDAERIRNTMSAMASTHGGVIIIGVADDGTVYGHTIGGEATHGDYDISNGAHHSDLRRQLRLTGFCPAMVKDSITLRQIRVLSLPFTTTTTTTTTTTNTTSNTATISSSSSAELSVTEQGKQQTSVVNVTSSCKMPANWWKIKQSPITGNVFETRMQSANHAAASPLPSLPNKVVTVIYVNKGDAPFYRNSRRSLPYWRTCASTTTMPVSTMISRLFVALYE